MTEEDYKSTRTLELGKWVTEYTEENSEDSTKKVALYEYPYKEKRVQVINENGHL